jgi:hypothetical protein
LSGRGGAPHRASSLPFPWDSSRQKPLPEDVCEVGHAPPVPRLHRPVKSCARLEGPAQRRIELLDDDVEVHMASSAGGSRVPPEGPGTPSVPLRLREQVDGRRGAEQLCPAVSAAAAGPKSEGARVEVERPLEFCYVHADAELGGASPRAKQRTPRAAVPRVAAPGRQMPPPPGDNAVEAEGGPSTCLAEGRAEACQRPSIWCAASSPRVD